MKGYFHFSGIRSLTLGQSLDGERKPMFNVWLEPGAEVIDASAVADGEPSEHLYVFGDSKHHAYLYDEKENDKDAYQEVIRQWRSFKDKGSG